MMIKGGHLICFTTENLIIKMRMPRYLELITAVTYILHSVVTQSGMEAKLLFTQMLLDFYRIIENAHTRLHSMGNDV